MSAQDALLAELMRAAHSDEEDRLSVIEHDEREDAYQRGYRAGVHDERERAVQAGVMRGGKYIAPSTDTTGAVKALKQVRDLLTTADGNPRPGASLAIGRIDQALRDAGGQ